MCRQHVTDEVRYPAVRERAKRRADAERRPRKGNATMQFQRLVENNGGPTETHALPAGSRAIGKGDPALLDTLDQRGIKRVPRVDMGAGRRRAKGISVRCFRRA
jgi:hypothetical protein